MDYFLGYFEGKLIIFKKNAKLITKTLALYNICDILYNIGKDDPSQQKTNGVRK